jgi:hypothetical protein
MSLHFLAPTDPEYLSGFRPVRYPVPTFDMIPVLYSVDNFTYTLSNPLPALIRYRNRYPVPYAPLWIRIRNIRIGNVDPEPGGQK